VKGQLDKIFSSLRPPESIFIHPESSIEYQLSIMMIQSLSTVDFDDINSVENINPFKEGKI